MKDGKIIKDLFLVAFISLFNTAFASVESGSDTIRMGRWYAGANETKTFTFDGTDSCTYYVDWGDNSTIQMIPRHRLINEGETTVSHTYSTAGYYNVKLWGEQGLPFQILNRWDYTEIVDIDGVIFKMDMVFVQGGIFTMGCVSSQANSCSHKSEMTRTVVLDGFYIGKFEVTQAQWRAVIGTNPSYFKGDSLPVEKVSWNDAVAFCDKLSEKTGKKYALPTEAQWEFAARGGVKSNGCRYSGRNTVGDVAWYAGNSGRQTHAVGTKAPNELGIYDMSGNVYEWCADRYGSYSSEAVTNPTGPSSGSVRVIRGGSWLYHEQGNYYGDGCRVSDRSFTMPDYDINELGFRVICLP